MNIFTKDSMFFFQVPTVTLLRKPGYLLTIFVTLFAITIALIFTPLGFPYSGNPESPKPQRFWMYVSNK